MLNKREGAMLKTLLAFFLGLLSFIVLREVGEGMGVLVDFIVMTVYFFVCQFLLSRGKVNAHLKDRPVMLALEATVFVVVFTMLLVENLTLHRGIVRRYREAIAALP
jgi:hypothetical protein